LKFNILTLDEKTLNPSQKKKWFKIFSTDDIIQSLKKAKKPKKKKVPEEEEVKITTEFSFTYSDKVYIDNIQIVFANARQVNVTFWQQKDGQMLGEPLIIEKEIIPEKPKTPEPMVLITEEECNKVEEHKV
jgi:hypothetical protein